MADVMNGGYSLSDLSAVLGKDGAFGGGSGSWLVMLLIFFLFFRNGSGFGGNFGEISTQAATQDSVRSILENQSSDKIIAAINNNGNAISQLAQSTGFSFDQMNQAISNVRSTIIETANATNLSIKDIQTALAVNNGSVLSALQNAANTVAQKVDAVGNQLGVSMLQGFAATDKTLCDIKSSLAADFSALQYQAEKNASALIQAGNANTDRILGYLTNDKIASLNTELALTRAELSQRDQTQNIVSQLKGSCGCNCGCGNSCNC